MSFSTELYTSIMEMLTRFRTAHPMPAPSEPAAHGNPFGPITGCPCTACTEARARGEDPRAQSPFEIQGDQLRSFEQQRAIDREQQRVSPLGAQEPWPPGLLQQQMLALRDSLAEDRQRLELVYARVKAANAELKAAGITPEDYGPTKKPSYAQVRALITEHRLSPPAVVLLLNQCEMRPDSTLTGAFEPTSQLRSEDGDDMGRETDVGLGCDVE